ncbi:MAG: 3-deoxy-D-manno-octulosonic acid transferase [Bacteroidales bacterium]|nr:3-deoxy-D-manno-octulosonic acid transferase [Bacteroidales bacterium]
MFLIYTIFIQIYLLLIRISSFFNPKAMLWLEGRRDIFKRMESTIIHDRPIVWFHCASLGEFEQGRPVIEAFREAFPEKRILLTFFSPSGYEIRKNYTGADYIFYLPIDTAKNAKRFVGIAKPTLAVFVKYEYWFNYMRVLKSKNIPCIYISAIFRPGQRFFKPWGRWQLKQLKKVDHFFVQNGTSANLLHGAGISQVTISGDTRFDRVSGIASRKKDFPLIETFAGENHVLLAGSTWPADEEMITGLINENHPGLKFIFAPHEVHPERIRSLMKKLPGTSLKFSEAREENVHNAKVLVIDSIGILSHLYQYATIAYIGGGFGVGIHNILEAATFGKPVIFGPNYSKFPEAVELIGKGGAFSINTTEQFLQITADLLNDAAKLRKASIIAGDYVAEKCGATTLIMNYLKKI